jgi:hypothetical protein
MILKTFWDLLWISYYHPECIHGFNPWCHLILNFITLFLTRGFPNVATFCCLYLSFHLPICFSVNVGEKRFKFARIDRPRILRKFARVWERERKEKFLKKVGKSEMFKKAEHRNTLKTVERRTHNIQQVETNKQFSDFLNSFWLFDWRHKVIQICESWNKAKQTINTLFKLIYHNQLLRNKTPQTGIIRNQKTVLNINYF